MDFPQLTMTTADGREESIMKRTTLVGSCIAFSANSSFQMAYSYCKCYNKCIVTALML